MTQLAMRYDMKRARRGKLESAADNLKAVLSDLGWHTWEELRGVAGVRYGARICDLRDEGYQIEDDELEIGKRYRLTSHVRGPRREQRVKVYLEVDDAMAAKEGHLTATAREAVGDALNHRTGKVRP